MIEQPTDSAAPVWNSTIDVTTSSAFPSPERQHTPWLTWLTCAACVAIFVGIGINLQGKPPTWEALSRWGYLSPEAVWQGGYWSLFSSVLVHIEIWHVAFNVYWMWILGGTLERVLGTWRWLVFFAFAAFVSSSVQLGVSGTTGHGASGVIYAIFGFIWMSRTVHPEFERVLSGQTVSVFFIWLVACIVTTWMGVWSIGNAAHISGLLFGAATAACFYLKRQPALMLVGQAALIVGGIVPLFWCPWQPEWVKLRAYEMGRRAHDAHVAERFEEAVEWYSKVIELDRNSSWAYLNRGLAHISLGQKDRAMSDLNAAIQRNQNDSQAHLFRARLYADKREFEKAIDDYSATIRLSPKEITEIDAYLGRAYAFASLREHAKSIADYDIVLRLRPDHGMAYFGRAHSYLSQRDFKHAIADYSEVIRIDPNSAYAYYNRGQAYSALGLMENARADIERAIELNPRIGTTDQQESPTAPETGESVDRR